MRVRITTKGVQGAMPLLNEFITNIPRVLGSRPLDEYAADTASNMASESPVKTGYLRGNIRSYRVDRQTVAVTSWAPYSGYVDQGTIHNIPRPFFSNNAFQSVGILTNMLGDASRTYLQQLINKYQSGL